MKSKVAENKANNLAIKMAISLALGLLAGTLFILLRENLISKGNSQT